MKVEEKRIFISDLPETATQTDIENSFRSYGNVISVEIKERKELGPRNNSLFFAYVNIEIDDKNLQQCFKYFSTEKWHGCYVILQIARESFLDRLKRERQENDGKAKNDNTLEKSLEMPQQILRRHISNGIKEVITKKYESSESESSDENSLKREDKKEHRTPNFKTKGMELKSSISLGSTKIEKPIDINETVDIIIKNNKGKVLDKNGLKIASVGNKPIIKIDRSKKKEVLNSSEANLKRLQSISNLKKGYQTQKSLIQAALSKIDSNSKSKIVFDKNIVNASVKKSHQVEKQSRISLFDDEVNEEEEFVTNFNIKEQFQGQEGQKLLELQSKYKNDKRFVLDARFLDKRETGGGKNANDVEGEEISLEEEKKKEYEILEQVLGKKINPKSLHQKEAQSRKKVMLRYDPTQPEHSKYEIKKELGKQKKRKRNESEIEIFNEEKQDEKEVPIVSKEIFYKVRDNLKESLDEKQEFSLLSIFGKKDERGEQNTDYSSKQLQDNMNGILVGKNPFRYDSSDEEETEKISKKDLQLVKKTLEPVQTKVNRSHFWTEPFFFKNDDYRLQEGFDFMEKMKSEEKTEFTKLRRDLKEIVKAKVRNNQRKHKLFKKKLGGSKKEK